jgi:LacI family transcriptional regulator
MSITQKEIARDLGLSYLTVNRALNNTGYVAEATREKIFAYAKKKNYQPHRASQALVRKRPVRLAVFSSTLSSYFWDDVEQGVQCAEERFSDFNYVVSYFRIPEGDTDAYLRRLRRELKLGLDGAAFVYQRCFDMEKIIRTMGNTPFIFYNADKAPSGGPDLPAARRAYVGPKFGKGGALAAGFIGNALSLHGPARVDAVRREARVLVISAFEDAPDTDNSNIITGRREGFLRVMRARYPQISCDLVHIPHVHRAEDILQPLRETLAKFEGRVGAVYFIPPFNGEFLEALSTFNYRSAVTVVHDVDSAALRSLESGVLTAAVYQDPFLQGYAAVCTLQRIVESRAYTPALAPVSDVEINHTLVFRENMEIVRNHYIF